MTKRFYIEAGRLASDDVEIDGALAHRIASVMRMRAGEEIALFDGSGVEVVARLDAVSDRVVGAHVIERRDGPAEPRLKLRLYQAIAKGERFEWLLEKGTEIGVTGFVPLICARSVVKTPAEGNRIDRWRRIVVEAAEQCGRGAVPAVEAPERLGDALASAPGVVLLPYERAGPAAPTIAGALVAEIDALFALAEVSLFIGPEGGFETDEVDAAVAAGAQIVTLGDRVLRSETAGLVAATLVMQAAGELG